ncbi:MAG: hypothetical protein ACI4E0_14180 [Blautia sp.]|nr:hypothetical protein [Blautia sp.]MDD7371214.1 hypothetical protein [Bacillota bacterium]MDY3715263.1 hypothetical protein [Blautia sp.]
MKKRMKKLKKSVVTMLALSPGQYNRISESRYGWYLDSIIPLPHFFAFCHMIY